MIHFDLSDLILFSPKEKGSSLPSPLFKSGSGCAPCAAVTKGTSLTRAWKLCQWSSSCSVGLRMLLCWLAGEAASHRQSCLSAANGRRGMVARHTVSRTTTFEWVCSWNVARWWLYNRLKGGVKLWRGSDKGSKGEAVEFFFFHCALFIYICQLYWPVWMLHKQNAQCFRTQRVFVKGHTSQSPHTGLYDWLVASSLYKLFIKICFSALSCVGWSKLQFTVYIISCVNQQKWFSDCILHPAAWA